MCAYYVRQRWLVSNGGGAQLASDEAATLALRAATFDMAGVLKYVYLQGAPVTGEVRALIACKPSSSPLHRDALSAWLEELEVQCSTWRLVLAAMTCAPGPAVAVHGEVHHQRSEGALSTSASGSTASAPPPQSPAQGLPAIYGDGSTCSTAQTEECVLSKLGGVEHGLAEVRQRIASYAGLDSREFGHARRLRESFAIA